MFTSGWSMSATFMLKKAVPVDRATLALGQSQVAANHSMTQWSMQCHCQDCKNPTNNLYWEDSSLALAEHIFLQKENHSDWAHGTCRNPPHTVWIWRWISRPQPQWSLEFECCGRGNVSKQQTPGISVHLMISKMYKMYALHDVTRTLSKLASVAPWRLEIYMYLVPWCEFFFAWYVCVFHAINPKWNFKRHRFLDMLGYI